MNDIGKNQGETEESSIFAFNRLANGKYAITARITPSKITQLTIPSEYEGTPVVRIKYFGFPDLKEVALTSSIRVIDKGAFDDCHNLSSVRFSGTREDWIRIKDAFPESVKVMLTESFVNSDVEEKEQEEEENVVTVAASAKSEDREEPRDRFESVDSEKPATDNTKLARFLLTFFLGFVGSFIINHTDLKPKGFRSRTFAYFIFSYLTFGLYPLVASISNFFFDPKKKSNIGYKIDPDDDYEEDED